jgi:imidazolonepropionase-like amidohydrolase
LDALRAGVTTLRRVGEINRADIALKRMINEGWVEGPRIVAGILGFMMVGVRPDTGKLYALSNNEVIG